MKNTKAIGYDPDGAQMVNDSARNVLSWVKNSRLVKWFKNAVKFAKRENSNRPLWKFVLGLIVCTCLAWLSGFKKYWIEKLFILTIINIWNALINNTFGFLIKGWCDNRKVK
jgi:undecaprenyl pyrophosphate phosphatase UppP